MLQINAQNHCSNVQFCVTAKDSYAEFVVINQNYHTIMIVKLFTHRYMVNIYDHLMPLNTFYNSIWHTYTHTHRYVHTLLSQYKTQASTHIHMYILIYSLPFLCA